MPCIFTGDASMFLYALTYWPGPMLYCFKWFNGGREFRLPWFMYSWMNARKYLGLFATYLMVWHTIGFMFLYLRYCKIGLFQLTLGQHTFQSTLRIPVRDPCS